VTDRPGEPTPAPDTPRAEEPLLGPGGKVDPDALRRYFDEADDDDRPSVAFVLQRDHQSRLDKYLTTRIPFMSRSQLQRLIDDAHVLVNGRAPKASTKLRLGDEVVVTLPPPPTGTIIPEEIPLEVLFEDEHLIVLNKQADIIVHPARAEKSGTLINALAWRFQHVSGGELSAVGADFARPGVVHRLDRNTSGCIAFAKDDETHWKLGLQFEHRKVDKRYLAVVHGRVEPDGQVIDLPIGPHPSKLKGYREKQVVRHDDLGKPSVTICRVRERYRSHDAAVGDQHATLVELELKTGRTHQIRVHLTHLGYPIVGDDMYAGRPYVTPEGATLIDTPALHAALLAFEHPITGEPMVFTAPPRAEMRALIDDLRQRGVEPVHVDSTVPLARFGL